MNGYDTEYEKLVREKSDAVMRYMAGRIEKMDYGSGKAEPEAGEDMADRLRAFAMEQDEVLRRAKSSARRKRLLRSCAVFALCFVVLGSITVTQVDAWRSRFLGITVEEGEQSSNLEMVTSGGEFGTVTLAASYVPEGYEVVVEDWSSARIRIVYSKGEDCYLDFTQVDPASYTSQIDNEHTTCTDVKVRGQEGKLFQRDSGTWNLLVWLECDMLVNLTASGEGCMTGDELMEFAESLMVIK